MNRYNAVAAVALAVDLFWWWLAERLGRGRGWVWIARLFIAAQLALFLVEFTGRTLYSGAERILPAAVSAADLIWFWLGPVLTLAVIAVAGLTWLARGARRAWRRRSRTVTPLAPSSPHTLRSRREFLGLAAAALPPLFTISLAGVALRQIERFRVRRFTLAVPGLPRDLDGATIAQVSDMHVGEFTSERVLRALVQAVNGLRADLVVLSGDLINLELSDLSGALDYARAMPGRFGHCLIEGNHDLFENGGEFARRARASGIPFLRNEATVLNVRGHPVQLLGLRWSEGTATLPRDVAIAHSVRMLLPQRQPDAFPLLLAHHPHAFDTAIEAGLPLTLAGHTHGGQLMLSDEIGAGPMLFRYWSGRYARGSSQLIVSNGVGNWFPLRVRAPAEVVHLTLRRA